MRTTVVATWTVDSAGSLAATAPPPVPFQTTPGLILATAPLSLALVSGPAPLRVRVYRYIANAVSAIDPKTGATFSRSVGWFPDDAALVLAPGDTAKGIGATGDSTILPFGFIKYGRGPQPPWKFATPDQQRSTTIDLAVAPPSPPDEGVLVELVVAALFIGVEGQLAPGGSYVLQVST